MWRVRWEWEVSGGYWRFGFQEIREWSDNFVRWWLSSNRIVHQSGDPDSETAAKSLCINFRFASVLNCTRLSQHDKTTATLSSVLR